jgi:hypothetical protein
MPTSFKICLFALSGMVAAVVATQAQGQSVSVPEKIVVSYPSKSITNFPILETARQKGFFQREGLQVSLVYIRGGLDIQTLLTNDADFAMGSTTAVTAFVAGAPLRIVLSYNAHVDQGLYAQAKYRRIADLKGQPIGSLNPGGLVDTMVRRILIKNGVQPERDVNLLAMGGTPERFAALKAGAIAATMLSSPFNFLADKEGFFEARHDPRLRRRAGNGCGRQRREDQEAAKHHQAIHARVAARDATYQREPRRYHAADRPRIQHGPRDCGLGLQTALGFAQPGRQKPGERIPIARRLCPCRTKDRPPDQRRTAH